MKTYYSNEEVKKDIANEVLNIDDDIEIAFDGFSINADIKCNNIYSKGNRRDINAGNINALNINARNITASDINAWDITASDINARDINASDINALNINALNINAKDINTWDINASDINARNITALNITALDITARDIKYHAVCFAYKNIKCKTIKGSRENAKHFCLDGEITYTKDTKKSVTLELTDEQLEKIKEILSEV